MGRCCGKKYCAAWSKKVHTGPNWETATIRWFLKCDCIQFPRGAGFLFLTPSMSEVANLAGSGITGQTRTDYNQSVSLSSRSFLNGWPKNKKSLKNLHTGWGTQIRQVRYKTFHNILLNGLMFNILSWARRKQDVKQVKHWELIYPQPLHICPPGLCKKRCIVKGDIFTADSLYSFSTWLAPYEWQ